MMVGPAIGGAFYSVRKLTYNAVKQRYLACSYFSANASRAKTLAQISFSSL
jgi:hypothetical protein